MAFHTAPTSVEVGAEESVLRAVVVVSMEAEMEKRARLAATLVSTGASVRGRVAKIVEALMALDALTLEEKAGIVADVHRSQMEEEGMVEGVTVQVTAWLGGADARAHVVSFSAPPGHVLATAEALEMVLRSIPVEEVVEVARREKARE
jgi:hypothetical protein